MVRLLTINGEQLQTQRIMLSRSNTTMRLEPTTSQLILLCIAMLEVVNSPSWTRRFLGRTVGDCAPATLQVIRRGAIGLTLRWSESVFPLVRLSIALE